MCATVGAASASSSKVHAPAHQCSARRSTWRGHAGGELITCPFCLDVWVATGFTIGLVFAPRLTRLVSAALTALTGADFLHLAYAAAQELQ